MDAKCEVCGVVTEISEAAGNAGEGRARTKLPEFECPACGTPHFVTRSGAHRLPRSVIAKDARRRLAVAPSAPRASVFESRAAADGERISDLRELLGRSSGTVERLRISQLDLEQELAPESVRETIRASLPPVSVGAPGAPGSTTPSWPPQVLDLEVAPAPHSRRPRNVYLLAAVLSAAAIVTAGGSALARKGAASSSAPAASAEVAASAIDATQRASHALRMAILEEQAAKASAASQTIPSRAKPQRARTATAPAAAAAQAKPAAAPRPSSPNMTLAQAIAAAAGAKPAAARR